MFYSAADMTVEGALQNKRLCEFIVVFIYKTYNEVCCARG